MIPSQTPWQLTEARFAAPLQLTRRPVAVTFLDAEPAASTRFAGTEPSGCSFWRLAAEGRVFYTVPADHFNCAVGSYTLNIPLSAGTRKRDRADAANDVWRGLHSARRRARHSAPARKPLRPWSLRRWAQRRWRPAWCCSRARPAAAMLLNEAAMRVGSGGALPPLGRPSCMALPAAHRQRHGLEPRLHREPRVHGPRRRRTVRGRARQPTWKKWHRRWRSSSPPTKPSRNSPAAARRRSRQSRLTSLP